MQQPFSEVEQEAETREVDSLLDYPIIVVLHVTLFSAGCNAAAGNTLTMVLWQSFVYNKM